MPCCLKLFHYRSALIETLERDQGHRLVGETDQQVVFHGVPRHVDDANRRRLSLASVCLLSILLDSRVSVKDKSLGIARSQEEDLAVVEAYGDNICPCWMAAEHHRLPFDLAQHDRLSPLRL